MFKINAAMEIPKRYNHKEAEEKWYKFWEENGFFKADPDDDSRPRYTISMPPPNVTGIIHIGHVLNNTLQDILIRWRRLQGYNVLWQPGTDHAGIATQNVVEKQLAREGKTRFDVGREEFVRRVWKWKEEYGNRIINQLKRLGVSADWSRAKFTMDPEMYRAVIEAFVRLFEKGLIYRGTRIINWCPRCGTALADDEVEHEEHDSFLWYIRYPLVDDPDSYIVVATTRPETYLGDTAVAVHPDDERYKHLIGKKVRLPLVDWMRKSYAVGDQEPVEVPPEIPIIADELVDPEFGTGAVKVTPAHDPNDYEMGMRHNLPFVLVMDKEARMNENAGPYRGMDRYEARERIIEDMKELSFLEKIEPHKHSVGHCYRCHTVIEPYLSEQWFVKMKPLAEPAIEAVKKGEINIIPKRFEKIYFHWLENVRDWCISRQIWWGHRIPVYYCKDCGEVTVSAEHPNVCPKCGSPNIVQDEDVLDTWFSSWLWPFSTLGWPEKTKWLEKFYPNDVLVSGWDILFFWVARMVMAGYQFMGEKPFTDIYLHGLVRDEKGEKISKSKGNFIDPIEYMERYGADALRISIVLALPEGQDLRFGEKRMESGRNFANKIWNASRLLLLKSEGFEWKGLPDSLELEDRWILTELNNTIETVTKGLEDFDFNKVANKLYDFFWHEYCDWYLEAIKPRLADDRKDAALSVAFYVLERYLKLLHPIMPFITEEIWQRLPNKQGKSIMVSEWPTPDGLSDKDSADMFQLLKELISELREIRAEFKIPPKMEIEVVAKLPEADSLKDTLESKRELLSFLSKVSKISYSETAPQMSASTVVRGVEFYVPLEGLIDVEKERARLLKEIEELQKLLERTEKKLSNKNFVEKAPSHVVQAEREKAENFRTKLEKLQAHLKRLK